MKKSTSTYTPLTLLLIIGLLLLGKVGTAQKRDKVKGDSVEVVIQGDHSPGKAALYSTIFPGLGQIYNKKYWKLPIVYGALAGGIYAISFNQDQYQIYLNAFKSRLDDDPSNDQFSSQYNERQLIELQNLYRRWRDLSIILSCVGYGLNVLDAYIDAHLMYYDVGDDLSLQWRPAIIQSNNLLPAFGVGITLQVK